MRLRHLTLILTLASLGLAMGCGEEPAPAPPVDKPPVDAGPTVPLHGLVIIVPSRAADRIGPTVGFDVLAEAELILTHGEREEQWIVQAGASFGQPGRLRFYLEPEAGRSDETADELAGEVYEGLAADLSQRLRDRIELALASAVNAQATDQQAVAAAQDALRTYLANRRGVPATQDSRREQARLEHVFETAVEALAAATAEVERLQDALDNEPTALRRVR